MLIFFQKLFYPCIANGVREKNPQNTSVIESCISSNTGFVIFLFEFVDPSCVSQRFLLVTYVQIKMGQCVMNCVTWKNWIQSYIALLCIFACQFYAIFQYSRKLINNFNLVCHLNNKSAKISIVRLSIPFLGHFSLGSNVINVMVYYFPVYNFQQL